MRCLQEGPGGSESDKDIAYNFLQANLHRSRVANLLQQLVREIRVDLLFVNEQCHTLSPMEAWHYHSISTAAIGVIDPKTTKVEKKGKRSGFFWIRVKWQM